VKLIFKDDGTLDVEHWPKNVRPMRRIHICDRLKYEHARMLQQGIGKAEADDLIIDMLNAETWKEELSGD